MDVATQQLLGQMQQQLQQQAQQLAHQQQLLQQQHAAAANAQPLAASRPLVKPKAPSTFNATDKAGELDQWEREMRYQFVAYGAALSTDATRIAHAVSYLGTVPLQWWDSSPAHQAVATWTDFVKLLRDRFRPVNAAKLARVELFKIRQGASQTAGSHAARVQELLVSLPNMHEEDRVHLFVASLLPALKRRVGDREFATLAEAINAAVQSEGLYGTQVATDSFSSYSSASNSGMNRDVQMDINNLIADYHDEVEEQRLSSAKGGPLSMRSVADQIEYHVEQRLNAMDGGRRFHPRRPVPSSFVEDLDEKTLKERMANDACIRCGSRSHWKNECPQAGAAGKSANRK